MEKSNNIGKKTNKAKWQSSVTHFLVSILFVAVLAACSSTKHVPDGAYLLDDVKINVEGNSDVKSKDLQAYLRQQPNHKVLWGWKFQLGFYNLSGKDSTNWFNRWVRRVGSAPEIYDPNLEASSVQQLRTALANKGYMAAEVTSEAASHANKKMTVTYNVKPGKPHYVSSFNYNIPDDTLRHLILADSAQFHIRPAAQFDRNLLDKDRQGIAERLRAKGYYAFSKENITYLADTAENELNVNLTMRVGSPAPSEKMSFYKEHRPFYVREVTIVTNYDPITMRELGVYEAKDTISYNGYKILYDDHYVRERVLEDCCFVTPGKLYSSTNVNRTYQAFGRLGILRFVNIELRPVGEIDGKIWMDAFILLSKGKSQSVSLSLEGTNSEGDLGFGVEAGYNHKNIFKGSETLNLKFRASYESLSGDLSGLINKNYSEYTAEAGITFPQFKMPFMRREAKQRVIATTELATNFNYQARPEYTRVIAGAGWKYVWNERQNTMRHVFKLVDFNYVYLPSSNLDFIRQITNPLLRYSYEDHFIMSMGYSFYHTNRAIASPLGRRYQENVFTVRAAAEVAGNLLYGISKAIGDTKKEGAYEMFGIRYSQYAKATADYSLTHNFNPKNSISFHAGLGFAVPYGNSTVLPFEKRFYSGGANSVRGWSVRTLGPGKFNAENSLNSFIYQCGDVRLDLNLEYRAKLFWVIELAAFIDAGNIWTIRDYEDQPGGVFKINEFYKQIALAYGAGLRLDFTYFLLRFDLGMKAHNPAADAEAWPIAKPNWKRDATFHFSVGYPF